MQKKARKTWHEMGPLTPLPLCESPFRAKNEIRTTETRNKHAQLLKKKSSRIQKKQKSMLCTPTPKKCITNQMIDPSNPFPGTNPSQAHPPPPPYGKCRLQRPSRSHRGPRQGGPGHSAAGKSGCRPPAARWSCPQCGQAIARGPSRRGLPVPTQQN